MEGIRGYLAVVVFMAHLVGPYLAVVRQLDIHEYLDRPLTTLSLQMPKSVRICTFLQRGHHAVDVFFMLSAFLIFRIRAKTANQFSYADFYRQRFFRIYPTFLVSLLAFCWFCTLYMKWYPFEAGMFFQNLVFLNGCPGLGVRSFNMVTWSLFYESFFYLVFPLLFLGIHQVRTGNPQKQFLAAALLLVAILFFYTWLPRFICFYFGILLGMCSDEGLSRIAKAVPTWLVVLFYLATVVTFRIAVLHPSFIFPFFGLASALLFIKACYGEGILKSLFSFRPLRFLGNISYSFYLIHPLSYWVASRWIDPLVQGRRGFVAAPVFFGAHFLCAVAMGVVLFAVTERWYFWYIHRSRDKAIGLSNGTIPFPAKAPGLPPAKAA